MDAVSALKGEAAAEVGSRFESARLRVLNNVRELTIEHRRVPSPRDRVR